MIWLFILLFIMVLIAYLKINSLKDEIETLRWDFLESLEEDK